MQLILLHNSTAKKHRYKNSYMNHNKRVQIMNELFLLRVNIMVFFSISIFYLFGFRFAFVYRPGSKNWISVKTVKNIVLKISVHFRIAYAQFIVYLIFLGGFLKIHKIQIEIEIEMQKMCRKWMYKCQLWYASDLTQLD